MDDQRRDHLVTLPGRQWALWRWVAVRGTGFPVSQPSRLAAIDSATQADAVLDVEAEIASRGATVLASLQRELESARGDEARALAKARNRVRAGDAEVSLPADWSGAADLDALRSAHERLAAARARFRRTLERETGPISDALCQMAGDDRFREAVLWQNRRAVRNGLASFVRRHRRGDSRDSRQRQNEEMIASYLQRYCLKNDTIGFFGPVGWATMTADGPPLVVRPGERLIAERRVYFETWCIDALAESLGHDAMLERWLAPMRTFAGQREHGKQLQARADATTLTAREAALLDICDGVRTVPRIARAVMGRAEFGATIEETEALVLEGLRALRQRDLVSVALAVPMDLYPERALEQQLQRIGDRDLRERGLRGLHALQAARTRVARAAGSADELDAALESLDERFTSVTGCAPTRSAGQTYAARTLVFEDCRRDAEILLGPDLVRALAPALALVLTSARWLTFETARRYMTVFREIHRDLVQQAGPDSVSLPAFLDRAFPLLFSERATPPLDAVAALQQRWMDIFDLPSTSTRAEYVSADLEARVQSAFEAPGAGWPFARYHSPDVMLAAHDETSVARGDYFFVLGELHPACNTLGWPCFLQQHPCPDALRRAADRDVPESRLEPIVPRSSWPGESARLLPTLISPKDFRLALAAEPSDAEASTVLQVGAFVVAREEDRLFVHTRDGHHTFDLLAVVAQAMTWRLMRIFSLLPPRDHAPRITIDRLVVARESWQVAAEGIRFADEGDEADRFLAACRWARERGFPRRVFVKAPVEPKPFYVDFASPTYVSILARTIRRTRATKPDAGLTVTEMLPEAEHAWLVDAEGRRYSSELRMVAVDLQARCGEQIASPR